MTILAGELRRFGKPGRLKLNLAKYLLMLRRCREHRCPD